MKRFLAMLVICVLMSGCALNTAYMNVDYSAKNVSPLTTLASLKFCVVIDDQRPAGDKSIVGRKENGFGMAMAPVTLTKEVPGIFKGAFQSVFEKDGHSMSDSPNQSDVLLTIVVKKYWSDVKINFFDIEMIGTINTTIKIQGAPNSDLLLTKDIGSTFRESRQLALDKNFESVLKGALAEYVYNFSRDPEIIDILKKMSESKRKEVVTA